MQGLAQGVWLPLWRCRADQLGAEQVELAVVADEVRIAAVCRALRGEGAGIEPDLLAIKQAPAGGQARVGNGG
ncbi:hypothetical protein D3C78_1548120 [compost metagenome]